MNAAVRHLNLVAWSNGVGLTRDLRLLEHGLRADGFDVSVSRIRRGKLHKWLRPAWQRLRYAARVLVGRGHEFDANLMLEHIREEDLPFAACNLFVPNPEWCLPSDVALLDRVDGVLAKTRHAVQIFEARGCRADFIGFTSEDRSVPAVPRERSFFHLAGRSRNKGTQALIGLWQRHPEWPRLVVLQSPLEARPIEPPAANIEHRIGYIDDVELLRLQNTHRFHLCPSETEGFGHYLVEAMSVGAVVIATDAPPMNEMVQPDRGILVRPARSSTQHLATTYFFDDAAMEATIEQVLAMPEVASAAIGDAARAWFLANHADFPSRLRQVLDVYLPPR